MFKLLTTFLSMFSATNPPANGCVSFQVAPGTGCDWMCSYCATNVGSNYYFTTDVCTYKNSGCVGSPQVNVSYTCCATQRDL